MTDREAAQADRAINIPFFENRKDLALLALLLVLAVVVRGWVICRTEVAARDSIGYIRYALELEKLPWHEVLRNNAHHPGYPLSILAVSVPVRWLWGGTTPESMQLSAQLVSALAGVLLVIPMFFLGKAIWNRQVGYWATVLFQFLPVSGQLLSDGVSEGLFLLLCACSMLFAVRGLAGSRPWALVASGVFCGLAYITRPEGAVVVLAAALVLVGMQFAPRWKRRWRPWALCQASLVLSALMVGGIYVATIGGFTNKPAAKQIMGFAETPDPPLLREGREDGALAPLFATIWADWFSTDSPALMRFARSLWAVIREFDQSLHYYWIVPFLLGAWWQRDRLRGSPGLWVLVLVYLIYLPVLCALGMKAGYVSDRHVMVLVLLATYSAALAVLEFPARFLGWWRGSHADFSGTEKKIFALLSLVSLVFLIGLCLPQTLESLHRNRAGYHAAGLWLAKQMHPGDVIVDDHFWAHYYAGLVFQEGVKPPANEHARRYFVIGRSDHPEKSQVRHQEERKVRSKGAALVYHWPSDRPETSARVVVYAMALK